MSKNIEMNILTDSGYDALYPKIDLSNVIGVLPVENGGTGSAVEKTEGVWFRLYVGVVSGVIQVFNLMDYNIFMGLFHAHSTAKLYIGCDESGANGLQIGQNLANTAEYTIFSAIYDGVSVIAADFWSLLGISNRLYAYSFYPNYSKKDYIYSDNPVDLWLYGAKVIF